MESHLVLVLGANMGVAVTSSQNFVGRMKGCIQGCESSRWEGVFSLSKSRVVN